MITKSNAAVSPPPSYQSGRGVEYSDNSSRLLHSQDNAGGDGGVLAVLALLSESGAKEREFWPQLKMGTGVVYDLGSGLQVGYDKLRPVEKHGLLNVSGSVAFACCPKCEDLNMQTLLICPECGSKDLLKSDLLIHYECQSTGPVGEFQSRITNGYYCHKCRKDLKRVGIDYGNPGIGFKCCSCDKVFQFPLVLSQCLAGHTSRVDEINLHSFPKYMLGSTAEGLSTLLIESRGLKDQLAKRNIAARILVSLKGSSGASHVVPLLLVPENAGEGEGIAVEFVNNKESDINQSVLQLLMKSADLEKLKMIVVHKGEHSSVDQIRSVVNSAKIRVLQAAGGPEELSAQIVKEIVAW